MWPFGKKRECEHCGAKRKLQLAKPGQQSVMTRDLLSKIILWCQDCGKHTCWTCAQKAGRTIPGLGAQPGCPACGGKGVVLPEK